LPSRDYSSTVVKMHAMAGEGFMPTRTDSGAMFAVAPVDDINAFAKKLDIGRITKIDTAQRTITVDAGGSR
jgi:hypothetical protein